MNERLVFELLKEYKFLIFYQRTPVKKYTGVRVTGTLVNLFS